MTNNVDVIMLTKNSERLLKKCLTSVYDNVPVNSLIVVDGYSTDRTLKIVGEFQEKYGNVVVIRDGGTRGSARQRAISEMNADWFMFVDSDVILCKDWYAKAEKLIEDDVGAIWGMEIWSVLRNSRLLRLFERLTLKIFQSRGGTHDLLVRTKAVEGIVIPFHLHTYEDSFIKTYIQKKGYEVVPTYDPFCLHFRPEKVWTIRQSVLFVASDLKLALRKPQLLLSYALYTLIVLHECLAKNTKQVPRN